MDRKAWPTTKENRLRWVGVAEQAESYVSGVLAVAAAAFQAKLAEQYRRSMHPKILAG